MQNRAVDNLTIIYSTIKKALGSLRKKEVITISGDTSREETLYKIAIPDEINICKELTQKSLIEEMSLLFETTNSVQCND